MKFMFIYWIVLILLVFKCGAVFAEQKVQSDKQKIDFHFLCFVHKSLAWNVHGKIHTWNFNGSFVSFLWRISLISREALGWNASANIHSCQCIPLQFSMDFQTVFRMKFNRFKLMSSEVRTEQFWQVLNWNRDENFLASLSLVEKESM